jgi:DNA polymerase-1
MASRQGELFDFEAGPRKPAQAAEAVAPASPPPASVPVSAPIETPTNPTVMLIDASGFIFRAYHALPPLTTSKGVPSHAVLGFTRMVLKLLRERRPTHLALCFDKDSRRGRLAIDPNYKANRSAPPDDLVSQFGLIRRMAEVLALPILEVEGWEADDVIATMVDRSRAQHFEVEIITSDKDFLQLLAPGVRIFDPMKDKPIGEAEALERFGVKPAQMRDYQALVGDAIDNIPKVPGIGPKTAVELISQFGSVEGLLGRLDEVKKPKIRQALKDHVDQLKRALDLVSFRHDLPVDAEPEALARQPIHDAEARALFTELEFFRLVNEMPAAKPTPLRQEAEVVADPQALEALAQRLAQESRVAVMPAFEGDPHSARLEGLGLATGSGLCAYVDLFALGSEAWPTLQGALSRAGLELITHDGKALLHLLGRVGCGAVALGTDVELLSYLMNPSRKEHALADLARERLRTELPPWPDGLGGRGRASLAEVPLVRRAAFFGAAADAVERLADGLWLEAETLGLAPLARELEFPLVPVLTRMEQAGVLVDLQTLREVSLEVDALAKEQLEAVYRHAGRELNVGSNAQLAQVLFEELKLPVLKRTKTGPSTDHEVLEKLAEQHALPQAIIDYRNVAKLKSTYLDTLPALVGTDGRIRTTMHQAQAATGRLSSSDPNLQNIPVRTALGQKIRRAFVAGPGQALVSADYSQVELRVLAHISRDEGLIAAFTEAADVHARTAAEVFGVPPDAVTPEQRRVAKMVNYGIAYGLSAHGLATRLNLPVDEAKGIIDRYFERFPGIARYVDETLERARRTGYVESLFGRRRYMPDLVSKNRSVAMAAERAAINMPIQGTAADLVKRAMLVLDRRIPEEGLFGRMLLQVHDELLFEAPLEEAPRLAALATEVMSHAAELIVPLLVEVGVGHSWADAH